MLNSDQQIYDYCASQSCIPSKLCESLAEETRSSVPESVMLCGPQVMSLLGFIIEISRARRILEIGTYTGYSALAMAERLPDDGELITLDINPETVAVGQRYWKQSPHGKKIRSMIGPANETLQQLSGPFDLIFIDADKTGYSAYLQRSLELLSPKGIIAADNCLYSGLVTDSATQDPSARAIHAFNEFIHSRTDLSSTLVPIRDGVHLITRK